MDCVLELYIKKHRIIFPINSKYNFGIGEEYIKLKTHDKEYVNTEITHKLLKQFIGYQIRIYVMELKNTSYDLKGLYMLKLKNDKLFFQG